MKKLLFLMLALLLFGCGGEESELDVETPEGLIKVREGAAKIFPLAVGSQWVFQMSAIDTTTGSLRPFGVDTFKIVQDTVIEGLTWYLIDGLGRDVGYVFNRTEGLYYARPGEKPFLFAKYPSVVGDTFTSLIGEIEAKTTVAATGLEIKVPAGNFFCHQYRQTVGPQSMITNYYFAPGVGLVKMEILDRPGNSPMAINQLIEIISK